MKTAIYLRVSTETQMEKGYGLTMQRRAIEEYCKAHGYTIDAEFADKGISGTTPLRRNEDGKFYSDRQGLADLMNSGYKRVIVYDSTRIARDLDVWGMISYEMRNTGIRLFSVKEPDLDINTREPSQIIMNAVRAGLADAERVKSNSRLADGRKNRAKEGYKSCGVAPYGYQYKYDENTGKSMGVFPCEEEVKIIEEMREMRRHRKNNFQIANALNEKGYTTRRGAKWCAKSVERIFTNPFYKGKISWGGEYVKGKHQSI